MTAAAESASTLPPLAALLPGADAGPDELLSRFVSYVSASGLSLYPAQEEALLELMAGKHVVLNTPTGSGKSLVATALHFKGARRGEDVVLHLARSRRSSARSSSISAGCSAPSGSGC